ncbi:hypothetical protein D9611_008260 [Ephemerocybe angulata]|uniref:Uncharacterized protein n=1 Tax=Ephemerocybe angulata TaxID=980116 RepID=A0A8H5BK65_9AGAR|nr:hypothetical protein D9611_008260 [Tulosesus angulatus]
MATGKQASGTLDLDHDQDYGWASRIDDGQRIAHRVAGKDEGTAVWISRDDIRALTNVPERTAANYCAKRWGSTRHDQRSHSLLFKFCRRRQDTTSSNAPTLAA